METPLLKPGLKRRLAPYDPAVHLRRILQDLPVFLQTPVINQNHFIVLKSLRQHTVQNAGDVLAFHVIAWDDGTCGQSYMTDKQ